MFLLYMNVQILMHHLRVQLIIQTFALSHCEPIKLHCFSLFFISQAKYQAWASPAYNWQYLHKLFFIVFDLSRPYFLNRTKNLWACIALSSNLPSRIHFCEKATFFSSRQEYCQDQIRFLLLNMCKNEQNLSCSLLGLAGFSQKMSLIVKDRFYIK